jgi:hypothetical protein
MDKSFVNNYLISKGKYFPTNKLNKIGALLENSNAPEYSITRGFYNPIVTIFVLFFLLGFGLMNFFDRLILRDWFWGLIKILIPIGLMGYYYYEESGLLMFYKSSENIIIPVIIGLYFLWLIIDIFTLYRRIKVANYRKLLRALNVSEDEIVTPNAKLSYPSSKSNIATTEIELWRKANPHSSINDYYKKIK